MSTLLSQGKKTLIFHELFLNIYPIITHFSSLDSGTVNIYPIVTHFSSLDSSTVLLSGNHIPDNGFIIREAIGQNAGGHFSPLVKMMSGDEDSSIFTHLNTHFNRTITIIKKGFEGTVDRLKDKIKKKVKQKVKEKIDRLP